MCTNEILNVGFGEADLIVDDVQGEDAKRIKSRLISSPSILEVGTASNLGMGGKFRLVCLKRGRSTLGKASHMGLCRPSLWFSSGAAW